MEKRPFKKDRQEFLLSKGPLSTKSKYLCTACTAYAKEELIAKRNEGTERCSASKHSKISIDELVESIESGQVDERCLSMLVSSICESKKQAMTEEEKSTTQRAVIKKTRAIEFENTEKRCCYDISNGRCRSSRY